MKKNITLLAAIALTFTSMTFAHEAGVLATLANPQPQERTVAAVKQALLNRGWLIDVEETDAVTARYLRTPIRARIRIVITGPRVLIYEDLAERQKSGNPNGAERPLEFNALTRESIDNLRADVLQLLADPPLKLPGWGER